MREGGREPEEGDEVRRHCCSSQREWLQDKPHHCGSGFTWSPTYARFQEAQPDSTPVSKPVNELTP